MIDNELIPLLREQFQQPLPGKHAQYKMATKTRLPFKQKSMPENARLASVLCLLYPKQGAWHLPLIQRVITDRDKHSGQISFPGGKLEASDKTYQDGAIREAREEIGIRAQDVSILGNLTPLYIPASNFQVHPFVGFLDYTPSFIPQQSEVAEVVEVALSDLLHPETLKYKTFAFRENFKVKDVPFFDVNQKTVWGATAMMLSEFIEVFHQANSSTMKNA